MIGLYQSLEVGFAEWGTSFSPTLDACFKVFVCCSCLC